MTAARRRPDPWGTTDLAQAVQALGLASAAAVADRYVGGVEELLARRSGGAGRPGRAWTWAGPEGPGAPDGRAAGAAGGGEGGGLRLPAVRPGGTSTGSVWVHNGTDAPVAVQVRTGALAPASGDGLGPDAVQVEVTGPSPLPPGGSTEVRLVVRVPPGTPAGHLHALLTCTATPDQALPVSLQVLPADGPA